MTASEYQLVLAALRVQPLKASAARTSTNSDVPLPSFPRARESSRSRRCLLAGRLDITVNIDGFQTKALIVMVPWPHPTAGRVRRLARFAQRFPRTSRESQCLDGNAQICSSSGLLFKISLLRD